MTLVGETRTSYDEFMNIMTGDQLSGNESSCFDFDGMPNSLQTYRENFVQLNIFHRAL